jgi:transposase
MQHIQGGDRNQTLLLPVAVDDYVGRENPVRFIEAFVDQCDLQEAGFRRVQPKDTGWPGYDPADLLKLYIHGYVNRVRSSRRLEAETAARRDQGPAKFGAQKPRRLVGAEAELVAELQCRKCRWNGWP